MAEEPNVQVGEGVALGEKRKDRFASRLVGRSAVMLAVRASPASTPVRAGTAPELVLAAHAPERVSLSGPLVPTIVAFWPAQVSAAPQFSEVRTSPAAIGTIGDAQLRRLGPRREAARTRLRETSGCPGPGFDHERGRRQHLPTQLAQSDLALGVQAGGKVAGWTDAEQERFPPVVEVRMSDLDPKAALLDLIESGFFKELREVALAGAGELRLVPNVGIEPSRRVPKQAQRPVTAAAVIPDARRDDAPRARNARHLTQPSHRVGHEMDDQRRERCVELSVVERQPLGHGAFDRRAGMTLASRGNKWRRGIDRCDRVCSQPLGEHGRQRTRTAPDVEHALTGSDGGEVGELRCERR